VEQCGSTRLWTSFGAMAFGTEVDIGTVSWCPRTHRKGSLEVERCCDRVDPRQQLQAALKTEAHVLFMSAQTRDLRNSDRFVFGCGTSGAAFLSDPVVMFILVLQTGMGSSH
jgi:hypothetical protein